MSSERTSSEKKNNQPNPVLDEQKFLACKFCSNFSAISEEIPTCEHCTSAIVNTALKYLIIPKPDNMVNCTGCSKTLYAHQTYLCECKINRFCYSCYSGSVWCNNCRKIRSTGLTNTIWSNNFTR